MTVILNKEVSKLYNSDGHNIYSVAVLTQDNNKEFAVYLGCTLGANPTENELWRIAAGGTKLNHHKATAYFPDLKESEYRL